MNERHPAGLSPRQEISRTSATLPGALIAAAVAAVLLVARKLRARR